MTGKSKRFVLPAPRLVRRYVLIKGDLILELEINLWPFSIFPLAVIEDVSVVS
jgi:hypothetical protein